MPFFSPVSSEQFVAPPTPQTAVVSDKLAALSTDEPLPEAYQVDRIRLLAQSPRKLHLYWEFARDPFETLRRAFGAQAARYTLVVRLIAIETGEVSWHEAAPSRSQWFNVQPDEAYRAELGFYARGRAFIRLFSSNVVRTPRAGVARTAAVAEEFHVSPEEFARVLDEAGYASDALEVSLEAADMATHDEATRAIAEMLGGAHFTEMSEGNLAELRSLLAALALGMNADDLTGMLSPPLAEWFGRVQREHSEMLRAAHVLEILRSTLGIQTSLIGFDEFDEEAMRRVARFVVGASRVNMPRRPFHIWMPSMTAGIFQRMKSER
ncbi:MAG TPA: DUF4912 domain-containing protein [Pyrinomonadaceae bacterium]|jgi:hypothetical protein